MTIQLSDALKDAMKIEDYKKFASNQVYVKMPVAVTEWVRSRSDLAPLQRLLLEVYIDDSLQRRISDDLHPYAKVSNKNAATALATTDTTIKRHKATLEAKGYIYRQQYTSARTGSDVTAVFLILPKELYEFGRTYELASNDAGNLGTPAKKVSNSYLPANFNIEAFNERFLENYKLSDLNKIAFRLSKLTKSDSNLRNRLFSELLYSMTLGNLYRHENEHAINIVLSLIKKGQWTTPDLFTNDWHITLGVLSAPVELSEVVEPAVTVATPDAISNPEQASRGLSVIDVPYDAITIAAEVPLQTDPNENVSQGVGQTLMCRPSSDSLIITSPKPDKIIDKATKNLRPGSLIYPQAHIPPEPPKMFQELMGKF